MISVLMSVYNESFDQIEQSVRSILGQTYNDLELIIINDAPEHTEMNRYLEKIKTQDDRIRVYNNASNQGLARSMNRAASLARGEYLARMDADDVSLPTRLEKEVKLLESGQYDFIFTGYQYIDENGNEIRSSRKYPFYSDEEIGNALLCDNIVHHPTVMFTKKLFDLSGGYRNFPCAQDYDLWLRMLGVSGKFHMIDEVLLKYRIRSTSITYKKSLQQKWTIEYSMDLYIERLKTGRDSFSEEHYKQYIAKKHHKYRHAEDHFKKDGENLIKAQSLKGSNKKVLYYFYRTKAFFFSPIYRDSYLHKIRNQVYLNKYKVK